MIFDVDEQYLEFVMRKVVQVSLVQRQRVWQGIRCFESRAIRSEGEIQSWIWLLLIGERSQELSQSWLMLSQFVSAVLR